MDRETRADPTASVDPRKGRGAARPTQVRDMLQPADRPWTALLDGLIAADVFDADAERLATRDTTSERGGMTATWRP
jgi:hypothetical protein